MPHPYLPDAVPGGYGGPVYDATFEHEDPAASASSAARLQMATGMHYFGDLSAAADAFSHYLDRQPSATLIGLAGLGVQQMQVELAVADTYGLPFPGLAYAQGVPPSFTHGGMHSTNPAQGDPSHYVHRTSSTLIR